MIIPKLNMKSLTTRLIAINQAAILCSCMQYGKSLTLEKPSKSDSNLIADQ